MFSRIASCESQSDDGAIFVLPSANNGLRTFNFFHTVIPDNKKFLKSWIQITIDETLTLLLPLFDKKEDIIEVIRYFQSFIYYVGGTIIRSL